jgi:predicted helicase
LIQDGREQSRCAVDDVRALEKILHLFFNYTRPEIAEFRDAVDQFKSDLPMVLEALRSMIDHAYESEPKFRLAAGDFLQHSREVINPSLTEADVREMLIQHILTEDVFAAIFPAAPFHQDNNVARELYKLEETFFKGNTKFQTLKAMEPYYAAMRSAAAQLTTHHEKQEFLKVIYENFYKVYNPKLRIDWAYFIPRLKSFVL